jgi:hypothetical protein
MSRAPQRHDYWDDWCVGSIRLFGGSRRPEELNVSARQAKGGSGANQGRTLGWHFCAD